MCYYYNVCAATLIGLSFAAALSLELRFRKAPAAGLPGAAAQDGGVARTVVAWPAVRLELQQK